MNNAMFKLLLDQKKLDAPILSMDFNLAFTMDAYSVYDEVHSDHGGIVYAQIYETNTSLMHVSLYQFEMDMVYFNKSGSLPGKKKFFKNIASERILSNFRFNCNIESYISAMNETSIMNVDVQMEPLVFAMGMRQLRKLMDMSSQLNEYMLQMSEPYFPQVKPEYIQNGKVHLPKRQKQSARRRLRHALILSRAKKIIQNNIEQSKKLNQNTTVYVNTNSFNNHMNLGVKIDKFGMVLFDNTSSAKVILLELNMTKLMVKGNMNSKIRDKNNMKLALYEMMTADIIPRTKFNLKTLAMYMDVLFSFDINYFNINNSEFEPLIERFNMGVNIVQVSPFFKQNIYVTTNDIINFDLSLDSIISLNKFMLTFSQNQNMWEKEQHKINLLEPINNEGKIDIQKETGNEKVLIIDNNTGLNVVLYFDDNPNYKISIPC